MANSDILKELVEKEVTVKLPTGEVVLTAPKEIDVIRMHTMAHPKKDATEQEMTRLHLETNARAIAACAGVDLELAKKALIISGGVSGNLARECMKMCGFGMVFERAEEELRNLDRPT